MIVNLLGPQVVVHPYADQGRETISVLAYDTRQSVVGMYDGLVYEERVRTEEELGWNTEIREFPYFDKLDDHCIIVDDIIRTNIVLNGGPRIFRCHHEWREAEARRDPDSKVISGNQRAVTLKLQDGMLAVQEGNKKRTTIIVMDLALELELKNPEEQDLWDHLVS